METWGRRVKIDPFKSLHDVCGPKVPAPHSFSKESNISICGWLVVLNLWLTTRRVALAASEERHAKSAAFFLGFLDRQRREGKGTSNEGLYLGQGVSKTVKVSRLQYIKESEHRRDYNIYNICSVSFTREKLLLDLSVWSPKLESLT